MAFSGGVDSTFLLKVAHDVLGDDVIAITSMSRLMASSEKDWVSKMSEHIGVVPLIDQNTRNAETRCS